MSVSHMDQEATTTTMPSAMAAEITDVASPPRNTPAQAPVSESSEDAEPSLSNTLSSGNRSAKSTLTPSAPSPGFNRILNLRVPIRVELAERYMATATLLGLNVGSIVDFTTSVDSELSLVVSNKRIGSGRAVKVGEKFGLRVTRIGSVEERIVAMGGPDGSR